MRALCAMRQSMVRVYLFILLLQAGVMLKIPLHTGGRSQRGQYRRRHRCNDLHNPLKSLFLRHNRLMVLMVNGFVG